MKLGIIRCGSYSDDCSAGNCLRAVREGSATFAAYDRAVLVGIDTCGGCGRGKTDRIVKRAARLRKLGAEVIHFGNCLVGPCPFGDRFVEAVEALGLKAVRGTH